MSVSGAKVQKYVIREHLYHHNAEEAAGHLVESILLHKAASLYLAKSKQERMQCSPAFC